MPTLLHAQKSTENELTLFLLGLVCGLRRGYVLRSPGKKSWNLSDPALTFLVGQGYMESHLYESGRYKHRYYTLTDKARSEIGKFAQHEEGAAKHLAELLAEIPKVRIDQCIELFRSRTSDVVQDGGLAVDLMSAVDDPDPHTSVQAIVELYGVTEDHPLVRKARMLADLTGKE